MLKTLSLILVLLALSIGGALACPSGQYENRHGQCVGRPHHGSLCRDGTLSYSLGRGTCRAHGGVWWTRNERHPRHR